MAPLVWLVTGASAGIGAALVDEIVRRGDKVIAANRQVDQMKDRASENVSLLELDITSGSKVVASKVQEAWDIYGHIDILVNNAGTFLFAPFEDIRYTMSSLRKTSDQLTLVFAAMKTRNAYSKPTSLVSFT
jgi:NADP-dependent 3-hydroxy acid dehydrogenase YdfG